ncbi:hypothetical protein LPB19_03490 [Marinobacter salinisoli]|uniref:Uncharacterized protein n=1 Tax=Marinobacter salinisoli TaxID=2769486 RepID=A0ABX7MZ68_9GAMM|nr:hypothetical protein [Marinobacter salinisoli]QSP95493.1 hypothetical protein LPB19_03490 [Marinobacter salinisoli]
MDRISTDESELKRCVSKAIELASSLLESDAEYLENVLELNSLGHRIVGEVWGTEFHVFGVIASDTDHLPTKKVRPLCSAAMLAKSDDELLRVISSYRTQVSDACRRILSKYQNV